MLAHLDIDLTVISSLEVYPNIFDFHVIMAPFPFLDSDYFCESGCIWKPINQKLNLKHSDLRYQGVKMVADGSVQQLIMAST